MLSAGTTLLITLVAISIAIGLGAFFVAADPEGLGAGLGALILIGAGLATVRGLVNLVRQVNKARSPLEGYDEAPENPF